MSTFGRLADRYGLEVVQLPLPSGAWTSASRIKCIKCGATEDIVTHKIGGSHMPVDATIKKLKQRGWSIRSKKAICPACLTAHQRVRGKDITAIWFEEAQDLPLPASAIGVSGEPFSGEIDLTPGAMAWFDDAPRAPTAEDFPIHDTVEYLDTPAFTEEPPMTDQNVVQLDATTPREPTREQKRRIHQEIEGNWDERAGRYLGSASDRSIAAGLSVPPAWVADIRADFFGDSGENADIAEFKIELAARIEDVEKLVENAMTSAARFDEILKEMKGLKARLERVEKSVLIKR